MFVPPGVQRYKRTKMVLPLRVWPDGENEQSTRAQLAHTVDISVNGGRLGGLRIPLQTGQTVTLQRGQNRAKFRVVWIKQLGPGEIQAGVESVESKTRVWGVDLPDQPAYQEPSQPVSMRHSIGQRIGQRIDRSIAQSTPRARLWTALTTSLTLVLLLLAIKFSAGNKPQQAATITLPRWVPAAFVPVISSRPRPYGNVRVLFSKQDADPTSNRLQVSEAPSGRITYPDAPDTNLAGEVVMKVVIATSGRVKEIHVLSGNRVLAESAVQAVKSWHYPHHASNGEAVEAETNVAVKFHGPDAVSIHFPSAVKL